MKRGLLYEDKFAFVQQPLEEIAMRARAGSGQNQFSFVDGIYE